VKTLKNQAATVRKTHTANAIAPGVKDCVVAMMKPNEHLIFHMEKTMTTCKGCGAKIKFIKMVSGKSMPVDLEPEKRIVKANTAPDGYRFKMVDAFTPHWATCPKAAQFKKKGKN